MREIKFRGWNEKTKEMISEKHKKWLDFFLYFDGEVWHEDDYSYDPMNTMARYIKLMQFTGLKDKNGKDIYEGDIVRNNWHNCNGVFIGSNYEVKFGEHETSMDYYASSADGWYFQSKHDVYDMAQFPADDRDKDIEIIGNIYENPELLEEPKDGAD